MLPEPFAAGDYYTGAAADTPDPQETQQAQEWWAHVAPAGEQFFSAASQFDANLQPEDVAHLMLNLEQTRSSVEQVAYPACMRMARWHLANAMQDLLTGLGAVLRHNVSGAQLNVRTSQLELDALRRELQRFDLA